MQANRQHVAVFSTCHVCFLKIFSTVFFRFSTVSFEFRLKISFSALQLKISWSWRSSCKFTIMAKS